MLPQETIRAKRDGHTLSEEQIADFIEGVTTGRITEGQVAAFCMAVLIRGMGMGERVALTRAMTHSGTVLNWKQVGLDGPAIDKHSTGGVGDKVSLILGPIVAACGGFVPMLSGRGLGHTGGTLDKFDAIPGYVSQPDLETFKTVVKEVGCAIVGATRDMAPADRIIYGVRDITATVESIDLITASILSKKLAAGLDALVLDVKFGSGAFMQKYEDAKALAQSLVAVAVGAGLPAGALLTDMNQVLGESAGNAVEVAESIAILRNEPGCDRRLIDVTLEESARLLALSGLEPDLAAARAAARAALESGRAAEVFARMVKALGGPSDLMERPNAHLKPAPFTRPLLPDGEGFVAAMDVRAIGLAIVAMGGGRVRASDPVDFSVGFTRFAGLGEAVGKDRPICLIHAQSEADADKAAAALKSAIVVEAAAPPAAPLVRDWIAA